MIPMAGRLRAKQIPTLRPGRHGNGGTLFLVVEPGDRSCHRVQPFTVDGKRRDLGLGGYPYVELAEALAAAFANRQLARRGGARHASGSRRQRRGSVSGRRTGGGLWSANAAPSWTAASPSVTSSPGWSRRTAPTIVSTHGTNGKGSQ